MNAKTQAIKASNDQAIAAFDQAIADFKDLVTQYKAIGDSKVPAPSDRQPGTWGAGRQD